MEDETIISFEPEAKRKKIRLTDSFLKPGLSRTLLWYLLALSCIPIAIIATVSFNYIYDSNIKNHYQLLNHEIENKNNALLRYLKNLTIQLRLQSESDNTQILLRDLRDTYKSNNTSLGDYIISETWEKSVNQYAYELYSLSRHDNFIDIYLIDSAGNILFSANEKKDLGLNIKSSSLEKTLFSLAIDRSLESGRAYFSDIEFYKFYEGKPAGFLSQTIVDSHGELLGVIAAQIELQPIERIMSSGPQSNNYVSSYILGQDGFLRNNIDTNNTTRLTLRVDNLASKHWFNNIDSKFHGQSYNHTYNNRYKNAQGDNVLGSYQPLNISGIRWAIFSEISEQEALGDANHLRQTLILLFALSITIVLAVTLYISRQIAGPISCIVEWAKNIGQGKIDMNYIITHEKEIDQLNMALIDIVKLQQYSSHTIKELIRGNTSEPILEKNPDDEICAAIDKLSQKLSTLKQQLKSISLGDYNDIISQLSDEKLSKSSYDSLSLDVAKSFAHLEELRWKIDGKYRLLSCILSRRENRKQDTTVPDLADNFISTLANILDANVGLLYLAHNEQTLKLTGTFSYQSLNHASDEFALGEGVVGQAALQAQAIRINSIPKGHIDISIGSGRLDAETIIVAPFFFENNIAGIIELAFVGHPEESVELFLEDIATLVGQMFHDASITEKLMSSASQAENHNKILELSKHELETKMSSLSQRLLAQKQDLLSVNSKLQGDDNLDEIDSNSMVHSFVKQLAHGLRTPIKRMQILAQVLSENSTSNMTREQVESARIIHGCSKSLLQLISDIHNLTRLETEPSLIQRDPIVIRDLTENLAHEFRTIIHKKSLSMDIYIDENTPESIEGDIEIVSQILHNIIADAIKYTNDGFVNLSIAKGESNFKNEFPDKADTVVFSVTDTGIGISTEDTTSVFDFKLADEISVYRDYRGSNINLKVSKRLSSLINGNIELSHCDTGGCRFDVIIPVNATITTDNHTLKNTQAGNLSEDTEPKQPEALQAILAPIDNKPPSDGIILVVDDDKIRVKNFQQIIATTNFQCFVSESSDKIETLAQFHNPIAIIVNPSLTNIDGTTVSSVVKISKVFSSIVTYVFSGDGRILRTTESKNSGDSAPIRKLGELLDGVELFSYEDVKHVLIVEGNVSYQHSITNIIEDALTSVTVVNTATDAYNCIVDTHFHCVVMEFVLPDLPGDRLLEQIAQSADIILPPVIIYTDKELTEKEHRCISRYSDTIIYKGEQGQLRVKQEVEAYLHATESNLPPGMRKRVEMIHSDQQRMNGKSVLLVDDDFLVTYPISTLLKQCGMTVIVSSNGERCLDLLETNGPFDIIIMDVLIPAINGVDAIKKIRAVSLYAELPIIALTSVASLEDRVDCLAAGASDYITKPVNLNALLSVMQIWLTSSEQKDINNAA